MNNAAFQMSHESLEEISDEEWEHTFRTNVAAMFHLAKAALPHMGAGSSIIGSSSVTADPAAIREAAVSGRGGVGVTSGRRSLSAQAAPTSNNGSGHLPVRLLARGRS